MDYTKKREELKRRVKLIPWPGRDNCFLVLSACWVRDNFSQPNITFTVVARDRSCAVEWDGHYGPIQRVYPADSPGPQPNGETALPGWIFDNEIRGLHWSQCAVQDHDLPRAFVNGDYDYIFNVLESWLLPRWKD